MNFAFISCIFHVSFALFVFSSCSFRLAAELFNSILNTAPQYSRQTECYIDLFGMAGFISVSKNTEKSNVTKYRKFIDIYKSGH